MNKSYLVLEMTQLDGGGVPEGFRGVEGAQRGPGGEVVFNVAGARVAQRVDAAPPPPRRNNPNPAQPDLGRRFCMEFSIFPDLHEAQDFADGLLYQFPRNKYVIFEAVSLFETVASPTIRKKWDANGQLLEDNGT